MKAKIKKAWNWLRKTVINKETFVFFVVAELIFWSPCIVCMVLALIIDARFWACFGAVCLFWAGPFTPAVPLQLALTMLLKKFFSKKFKK